MLILKDIFFYRESTFATSQIASEPCEQMYD